MSISLEECKTFINKSYSVLVGMTVYEIEAMIDEIEAVNCGVVFDITDEVVTAYHNDELKSYCERKADV